MALGEKLRNAREQRGLTTSQVAEATRLMVQQVEELEREDFHRVAAPIYGKGFIKLYAEFVGIDPAPLVSEFQELFTGTRRPPVARRGAPTVTPPARSVPPVATAPERTAVEPAEAAQERPSPSRPVRLPLSTPLETPAPPPPPAREVAPAPPVPVAPAELPVPPTPTAPTAPTAPVEPPSAPSAPPVADTPVREFAETPADLPVEPAVDASAPELEAEDTDLFTLAAQRAFAGQPVAQTVREPTRSGDPLPGRVRPSSPPSPRRAPATTPIAPSTSTDQPSGPSRLAQSWQLVTRQATRLARRATSALPPGWSWPVVGVSTAAILVVAALVTFGVIKVVQHARRPTPTPPAVHLRVLPPPAPYMD